MNIAIDLDRTIDRDTEFFAGIVELSKRFGHRMFLVSSRSDKDKSVVRRWARKIGIPPTMAICTSGAAKRWFCEQRNLDIHVWIDDDPNCIENGK